MTVFQAIVLGMVQGATEFLPISSSGHLVLVPALLGWHIPPQAAFVFDVLVQLGTLLAVIVYFWDDLSTIIRSMVRGLLARRPFTDEASRLGWLVGLATVPAVVLGLPLKSLIEQTITSPKAVGGFLIGTAALLLIAERVGRRQHSLEQLQWSDALWIGLAQVLALFPGVSRSGATISGGMSRHLERAAAARFSFLMAVPVMLAASVIAVWDFIQMEGATAFLAPMLVGFATATLVGYLAIRWLMRYLSRHSLALFAGYCLLVGTLVILLL